MSETLPWLEDAACKGRTDDFFFQTGQGVSYAGFVAKAQGICYTCPSLEPCRDYARTYQQRHGERIYGVWGGEDYGDIDYGRRRRSKMSLRLPIRVR